MKSNAAKACKKNHKTIFSLMILSVMILNLSVLLTGCQVEKATDPSGETKSENQPKEIILAEQFGIAYAPLQIMKAQGFLEKELVQAGLDQTEVKWKQLGNTTAIREAMLSGDLDVGFVGIPPFLLGLDNGMDWKIMCGLSESRVSLMTKDPKVEKLKDLKSSHKIILPQPGSIQHILLQMAAEKVLGDANAFDQQLLALAHPDGVTTFTAGDEQQLHFTTPPYIQKELQVPGAREILEGKAAFGGDFTFIVGICPERFAENEVLYQALLNAIEKSILYMNEYPEETILVLSEAYEYSPEELKEYLKIEQMKFSQEVKGVQQFVEFMFENGDLKKIYEEKELFWEK